MQAGTIRKGAEAVSKYEPLWGWLRENGGEHVQLTFAQIAQIAGVPIDHSFLKYKKELSEYGYRVGKISMKAETVTFEKCV